MNLQNILDERTRKSILSKAKETFKKLKPEDIQSSSEEDTINTLKEAQIYTDDSIQLWISPTSQSHHGGSVIVFKLSMRNSHNALVAWLSELTEKDVHVCHSSLLFCSF